MLGGASGGGSLRVKGRGMDRDKKRGSRYPDAIVDRPRLEDCENSVR